MVIANGLCRRPYAEGTDAIVAVDQIIQRSIGNPGRPHYLFLTGDQIYADDLSETLLGWANDLGIQLVGKMAISALEQLRLVSFPADRNHFPIESTDHVVVAFGGRALHVRVVVRRRQRGRISRPGCAWVARVPAV